MAHIVSDMPKSEDEKETILWKGRKSGNAALRKANVWTNVAKVEVMKNSMSGRAVTSADPRPRPIKIPIFPEPTFKEVYARALAARKRSEQILGQFATQKPNIEDDLSVAEFQVKGIQRRWLDDRIYEWLRDVPESGFDEGQRKLSEEETKDWLLTGKKLKRVKVNDEAQPAGSWVNGKFYPVGFW
ncbi:hypothetical protein G7Y79_00012g033280 [Physcia stellaris]|nr:hypothetical protein G7Y79_00012g033280 [Physcia stellaris]